MRPSVCSSFIRGAILSIYDGAAPLKGCTIVVHICVMQQQVLRMVHAVAGGLEMVAKDPLLPVAA